MKKIYIISFVSLIAIFAMLMCAQVVLEYKKHGPAITLPSATYAKCSSYSPGTQFAWLTVDKDGSLFFEDKKLTISEFQEVFEKYSNCVLTLRVDQECKFGDLQPLIIALNGNTNIVDSTFGVYEQ